MAVVVPRKARGAVGTEVMWRRGLNSPNFTLIVKYIFTFYYQKRDVPNSENAVKKFFFVNTVHNEPPKIIAMGQDQ